MSDKNFTRKEKSAYYSQCMQMYKNLYDLTKEQIKERGYASHRNLIRKICSTKNIVNAIRSISKNTGGRTAGVDGTTIKDIKKYNRVNDIAETYGDDVARGYQKGINEAIQIVEVVGKS